MLDLTIAIISYKAINLKWLKELRKTIDARITVIFDEPVNNRFTKYCDSYLVNFNKVGFGKARKLSMLLGSEFNKYCIITDGDGQFPIESIHEIFEELQKNQYEVIIPQRTNKKLYIKYGGKILDRNQFELLENLCALEEISDKNLDYNFDIQPGLYAFRSSVVNKILPNDSEWLADLETTIKAINHTVYRYLPIKINESVQKLTSLSIDEQINKFKRIIDTFEIDIYDVYEKNYEKFKHPEKEFIEKLLNSIRNNNINR